MTKSTTALVLVLGLAWVGCGAGADAPTRARVETPAAASVAAGTPTIAPDFTLPDLEGRTVQLSASAGNVRLVDFWATWCAPCREEIPMLNELHRMYADHGLTILAIAEESPQVVRDFAESSGVRYVNLLDEGDVGQAYRVRSLPTAFLVDREGKIVKTYYGAKPRRSLEQEIRQLLDLPPAT